MKSLAFLAAASLVAVPLAGQLPQRQIRRTIPITRSFVRGLAAGTRDSTGRPGPHYWQLWTDYRIAATLDPASARLTGRETITITNPSDSTLGLVWIRLLQNHFAPNVPRDRSVPELSGGITITRLVVNGDTIRVDSLAPRWTTRTVVPVPARTPIAAHGTGTIEAEWYFTVPEVPQQERGERMGRWDSQLFQVAQWYPQLAMYDDLGGWATDPYLGNSEFYNNFGSFDVHLTLPAGWLVGATGTLVNPDEVLTPMVRERLSHATASDSQISIVGELERGAGKATATGDSLVWHFRADSVADFAWATSDAFVWDATRATIPGSGPIPINLLYLPEHDRYKDTGAFARHALEFYSGLWMPYAWPEFTQVDGPEGGMEYPSLTMSGPGFGVTDHEIGHQWWPMMVGVNETWYGWMDEGFNSYMNVLSRQAFRNQPQQLDSLGQRYGALEGVEAMPPMMWDANYAGPLYVLVTYRKSPMMFSALGGIVGDTAVARAMSTYARAWRFKHPSPWDFMFAMDHALGRDLGWFWYYWLFTNSSVDGSIARVAVHGHRTTVTVRQDGDMPAPVVLKVEFAAQGPPIRRLKNAVIRGDTAVVTWPVNVWFGGSRTFAASFDFGGRRIERITLDPEGRFPDHDPNDNVWTP